LATAFLVNSDIYGIESDVCDVVAKKHMEAVDFPKTGEPPQRLKRSDPASGKPSEDPPRKPGKTYNFKIFKNFFRLYGTIFQANLFVASSQWSIIPVNFIQQIN
jgi:hypothetical protein